jgi:hypothetical protein
MAKSGGHPGCNRPGLTVTMHSPETRSCRPGGIMLESVVTALNQPALTVWAYPMSWAEVLGFVTGLLCVWLVGRRHILNFPVGIANCALLFLLFFEARLFADAGLQLVFILLGFQGWWLWSRGVREDGLAVSRLDGDHWIGVLGASVLLTGCMYLLLTWGQGECSPGGCADYRTQSVRPMAAQSPQAGVLVFLDCGGSDLHSALCLQAAVPDCRALRRLSGTVRDGTTGLAAGDGIPCLGRRRGLSHFPVPDLIALLVSPSDEWRVPLRYARRLSDRRPYPHVAATQARAAACAVGGGAPSAAEVLGCICPLSGDGRPQALQLYQQRRILSGDLTQTFRDFGCHRQPVPSQ